MLSEASILIFERIVGDSGLHRLGARAESDMVI